MGLIENSVNVFMHTSIWMDSSLTEEMARKFSDGYEHLLEILFPKQKLTKSGL